MTHPEYIGIDLHRRRSVVVRMDAEGQVLSSDRIDNDPEKLQGLLAAAGPDPEVVLEATYGWYWAVDACQEVGARVHLAHPLGVNAFKTQRVKQDHTDARHLADLLRMNRLPEAWIAPPQHPRGAGAAGADPLPSQAGGTAQQLQVADSRRAG